MSTIGRHWKSRRPGGDFTAMCAYCGAHFPRSELRKDAQGFLVCEGEGDGKDQLTLDRLNAQGARDAAFRNRYRIDGGLGAYVGDTAPTYESWLGAPNAGGPPPVAIPPNVPPMFTALPDGVIVSDLDYFTMIVSNDGNLIVSGP